MEYKQELSDARLERHTLRTSNGVSRTEHEAVVDERDQLVKDLHLTMLANREDKFIHLCEHHKSDGYEGLCRQGSQMDDVALDKAASKTAYSTVLTHLERIKQQPFVCAGCVTQMYHSFDRLFMALSDYTSDEVHEAEDVMTFLMALTSRLSEQGEVKVCEGKDGEGAMVCKRYPILGIIYSPVFLKK